MPVSRIPTVLCLPAGLLACAAAFAQDSSREVVLPVENVRYDYAQVLAVRPVYQVLRTTGMERVCDGGSGNPLSRVVTAVKDHLSGADKAAAPVQNCRMEPVAREYRRAIAYDVDYMYRGSKFRTRMDADPGNRLRIRISITPRPAD
ncbi:hypothetical protein [Thermomonas sp.]|uniref:hypothetical protein n=1 Tax=Thermomonas sp. TaxID=1971895 RepID=UPI0035AF6F3D